MKTKFFIFLVFFTIFLSIISYGDGALSIETEKKAYTPNQLVYIKAHTEPNVSVSFQIIDPANNTVLVLTNKTDINGTAAIFYRLGNITHYGSYHVFATVKLSNGTVITEKEIFTVHPIPKQAPLFLDTKTLSNPVVFSTAIGIGIIVAIGVIGATELGKYNLFLFFLPLYTRIAKEEVRDQYTRGRIYQYIEDNPGAHYNLIKEKLAITNGTLTYHLSVLEREEQIKARNDGFRKRFYPFSMKIPERDLNISAFRARIISIIKEKPGISQKEIAELLGESREVAGYHLREMARDGLIKAKEKGREVLYYLENEKL
ncbi:MAG: winged helix-turn-helix transcriptional regulator [Candidatus Thermoplasmatota archaeon]